MEIKRSCLLSIEHQKHFSKVTNTKIYRRKQRFYKSGMNPKALQYLMGHSDISVTLNVYTHVKFEDAKAEIERIANV